MKTIPSTICIISIVLAACGDRTSRSTETPAETHGSGTSGNRMRLTTELPPELIEGTPRPITLPLHTPVRDDRPQRIVTAPYPEEGGPPRPQPHGALRHPAPADRERYGILNDNAWQAPVDAPLSTFSIDVDTASYANVRRMILDGRPIPEDAVRLEEMVNYFDYDYPQPAYGHPFGVHVANSSCPWNPERQIIRIALRGREVGRYHRPPANLVFLVDVSGSMNDPRKLPLVTASLRLLIEELNASDTVSMVVYAGAEGLALPPTACDTAGRGRIEAALESLRAGGSTNGGAGITLAYRIAREQFKPGGINRVILATDGDFNVGVTHDGGLVRMVGNHSKDNIFLTVIGTGAGNLNDGMLEAITNKGNGVYHYIDSIEEARRVFLHKLTGNLIPIARDVKIQVEFNPARVRGYRLLGYANRMLRQEEFRNDRIDAGDIGSGHTVTAFYEIEPGERWNTQPAEPLRYGAPPQEKRPSPHADGEWLNVKLRYKQPDGGRSTLLTFPFTGACRDFNEADADFRFGVSVAMSALVLRGTSGLEHFDFDDVRRLAAGSIGADPHGLRSDFVGLLDRLKSGERRFRNRRDLSD